MKVSKLIALVVMATVSFLASAATFDSFESCKKDNKEESYVPTKQAKGYPNRAKGKNLKVAKSEADGCYLMTTAEGKRWVFLAQGTDVLVAGAKTVMLVTCQNDIFEFIPTSKKDAPPTKLVRVKEEVVVEVLCKQPDGSTKEAEMINGKATCSAITIEAPVVVNRPQVIQQATTECNNCRPEVTFEKKVARTDGRCVVEFKDREEKSHFARFDTERGTSLLVAARVDNEQAEWNHFYNPTYVGYIANGEKKTVKLDLPADCGAVYKAISHPTVLAWTGPRLGLTPDCVPVGRP